MSRLQVINRAKTESAVLPGIEADFDWVQYPAYEKQVAIVGVKRTVADGARVGHRLIGRGRPLLTKPLDQFPGLYLQLAAWSPTDAGHESFARKFGLLTNKRTETEFSWVESVASMRNLVELAGNKEKWKIKNGRYAPHEIERAFNFRFERTGDEMKLSVVPLNLYCALVFQCVSHLSSGAKIRVCKSCQTLFEVGGTSGRRFHAECCSDSCRYQFNHRNRSSKK